jgi:hypothetical protein
MAIAAAVPTEPGATSGARHPCGGRTGDATPRSRPVPGASRPRYAAAMLSCLLALVSAGAPWVSGQLLELEVGEERVIGCRA